MNSLVQGAAVTPRACIEIQVVLLCKAGSRPQAVPPIGSPRSVQRAKVPTEVET